MRVFVPVERLWVIDSQSESEGGVASVMTDARSVTRRLVAEDA